MVGNHYPESAQFFYQDLLHVIHKALLHGGGGEALGNKITMTPSIADRLMRDYIINTGDRRMAMMQIWKLGRSILYVLAEGYTPPKRGAGGKPGDPTERLDWAGWLTNCLMMGIQPSEAKRLTWWEYQAFLWNWNDRHDTGKDNVSVEPPTPESVLAFGHAVERRGLARMIH
jgi:hypothetical protein